MFGTDTMSSPGGAAEHADRHDEQLLPTIAVSHFCSTRQQVEGWVPWFQEWSQWAGAHWKLKERVHLP